MSFDNSVVTELKKVLGWKDFWDLVEIPALGSPLNDTESGEYYQDFSGALRLDYISSLLAPNRPLTTYLDTVETESITQVLNTIETTKQLGNFGKELAASEVVFNVGRKTTTLTNEGRFSGVMFEVNDSVGLRATINRIGLYLTAAVTNLDLYLFHSSQEDVVQQFTFTSTTANSFSWNVISRNLDFDYGTNTTGGTWYLGYYQDDLATQTSSAIQYNAMNWLNGYCNQCGQKAADTAYKSIRSRVVMSGFYVQSANLPVSKTERFDPTVVIKTNNNNHGFNFHISVGCNLTQFWIENRLTLKKVIGLKVAMKVLEMMKFSSQINNIEEAVKIMIIRDLEGASDTGNVPMWKRLEKAIKALNVDEGNLDSDCLPCARKPKTSYGALG
jgi:hypothetical protein